MKKLIFATFFAISAFTFASSPKATEVNSLKTFIGAYQSEDPIAITIDKKTNPEDIKRLLNSGNPEGRYIVTACDDYGCFSFGFNGPTSVLLDWILWWLEQPSEPRN